MNAQVIQTSFKVRIAWPEYERICQKVAEHIAAIPGLVWKAWVINEVRKEGGGIYLFESAAAADSFLNGPIVSQLETNSAFEDVRIKSYDLLDAPSAVTRFCAAGPAMAETLS